MGFPRPHATVPSEVSGQGELYHFLQYVCLMCPLYVSVQDKGASEGAHTALLAYPLPNAAIALTKDALDHAV